MIHLDYPEFKEIQPSVLPQRESEDVLKQLREDCKKSSEFRLQSHQRFLRRVMSPDSPVKNVLIVHGTGVGKTCTAIQIAEEYIMRPEYQDKKVLVIASDTVKDNFRKEVFDIDRVKVDSTLESKQCTGRRYLDMLKRIESEPKNWKDVEVRERLRTLGNRIIDEFYEFQGYSMFGTMIQEKLSGSKVDVQKNIPWIKETFDNRLLIIDEAHRITDTSSGADAKAITEGLLQLVDHAEGLVLVLMTATPMFDTYKEIEYYMNLFLRNDRELSSETYLDLSEFFTSDLKFVDAESERLFREWCQKYVSYVRGESPFTFPFRLTPEIPDAELPTRDFKGKQITARNDILKLYPSMASAFQQQTLASSVSIEEREDTLRFLMEPTLIVLPENKAFTDLFRISGQQYEYTNAAPDFLGRETLGTHSAKYKTVIDIVERSEGVALVYSNYVTMGAQMFAMALEEHGYKPAIGSPLLKNRKYTGADKAPKYALLTSKTSSAEILSLLRMVKKESNRMGNEIKIIVASPVASEGIDFQFIRQVHILDPWWNMSRIEQVVGRGLRTCSHKLLDYEDQNCTIYFHVVRTSDKRECYDETTYRGRVVPKAINIAKIRRYMEESAMDCPLQNQVNTLPPNWRNLKIHQRRAENNEPVELALGDAMAPTFSTEGPISSCKVLKTNADQLHIRPLSTYNDMYDEILSKVRQLFIDKPIWDRAQLMKALQEYDQLSVIYNLQRMVRMGERFKDSFGRPSTLETKGDLYTLNILNVPNATVIDKTTQPKIRVPKPMKLEEEEKKEIDLEDIEVKLASFEFSKLEKETFDKDVLNSFAFDRALTPDEKAAAIVGGLKDTKFLNKMRFKAGDTTYAVLDHETTVPKIESLEANRAFDEWKKAVLNDFIKHSRELYAGFSSVFVMSKIKEDGTRDITKAKRYTPISCGTGSFQPLESIKLFATKIDESEVPTQIKSKIDWCRYVELLARKNSIWITPPEYDTLFADKEIYKLVKEGLDKEYAESVK